MEIETRLDFVMIHNVDIEQKANNTKHYF